jgi:hypothetical protein
LAEVVLAAGVAALDFADGEGAVAGLGAAAAADAVGF